MKSLRCIQIFLPETERFEYPFRNNERSFKPHQLVIIFAYLVYTETNETKSVTKSLFRYPWLEIKRIIVFCSKDKDFKLLFFVKSQKENTI